MTTFKCNLIYYLYVRTYHQIIRDALYMPVKSLLCISRVDNLCVAFIKLHGSLAFGMKELIKLRHMV